MTVTSKIDRVQLIPVQLPLVRPGQSLPLILQRALLAQRLRLRRGDIVCVASKVVSAAEGRIEFLNQQRVTRKARNYADRFRINPALAQIVVNEADEILGGVKGFLLTIKSGILSANAGVDVKNSPRGTATLWPADPDNSATVLRNSLEIKYRARIGVLVVDSRVTPLRLGTTGLTIGSSGFNPIRDDRGKMDLYNRTVKVTQTNVADDLAASAHLLMSERDERIGLVIIRNAPVPMRANASSSLRLAVRKCLVCSVLVK
ncbi:MAG TPA: coenzyme F420-0:L-glutamate ligase [Candidatus Bathyarchaeia archaeon]|nr:coenzyme F420-0:L-glutamate ligase [Candidatus Bathyarchaeia archaeon]